MIFDNIVDLIFLVDMVLMCITSYLDPNGREITDSVKIIKKYVFSRRFVTDFLALLGTGIVTQYFPKFQLFGFFKMVRIFRLGGMISRLNVPADLKALLNLFKFTFYLCLYNHVIGCIWFSVVSINAD